LKDFYHLVLLTRRRHRLLPQPFAWFRNLAKCCGENLTIWSARAGGRPIASILTLQHKRTLIYKYGCSDARFHNTGAMPRLFWQAIREGHSNGLLEFDLGRSEETDSGLIRFKDRLGAQRVPLRYLRRYRTSPSLRITEILHNKLGKKVLPYLPDTLLKFAGEVFYRHAGMILFCLGLTATASS
jgi:hypothetical protein